MDEACKAVIFSPTPSFKGGLLTALNSSKRRPQYLHSYFPATVILYRIKPVSFNALYRVSSVHLNTILN